MKMLKTLLVSVLFVAQVSAVPTSDTQKARLAASIRNLELNLGILKKKPQPQKTMISKIGNTIKNNKGKIALGVGLITLGVLAYKNPAVVVNGFNSVVGTAKNFLFGKTAQVAQPMTSVNEVFGKMHANNLFKKAKCLITSTTKFLSQSNSFLTSDFISEGCNLKSFTPGNRNPATDGNLNCIIEKVVNTAGKIIPKYIGNCGKIEVTL